MRRLALARALGIAVILIILPSAARAGGRHGHGAIVVASQGAVVVVPRPSFVAVNPVPRAVIVAPQRAVVVVPRSPVVVVNPVSRAVIVAAPRAVFVAAPAPFVAVQPLPHCGRWWWDGWRWVWIRAWC
jgi:hypothetical protein